jgi:hypothetical protein
MCMCCADFPCFVIAANDIMKSSHSSTVMSTTRIPIARHCNDTDATVPPSLRDVSISLGLIIFCLWCAWDRRILLVVCLSRCACRVLVIILAFRLFCFPALECVMWCYLIKYFLLKLLNILCRLILWCGSSSSIRRLTAAMCIHDTHRPMVRETTF